MFLENTTGATVRVSTDASALSDSGSNKMLLSDGDQGILVIAGDSGTRSVSVSRVEDVESFSGSLTWRYIDDEHGKCVEIVNSSKKSITMQDDGIVVAKHGLRAGVFCITGKETAARDNLWQNRNTFKSFDNTSIGDPVSVDDDVQLYAGGVMVSRAKD